ncbi:TetR/AcrR family transcriptional regulator [Streptomyces tsukubensis]|uniref:TetR/AcrR family transcriptional regulator n=1 Tax=Streptomyces tsukubensis TaxID=83656 RepID=UPI0009900D0D|nr:TetR/AcrR family transcriptional regulator [Streptomyces tsukubensis]QFR96669.1 TetR family transcriptional regulator [Streptomyces tsukubensis]
MQHVTSKGGAPGLRERKKQATRTALAEAAVRLAAEHGAENVTVEAISEAAGVSPRTFFNYFNSHDDAFVMVDPDVSVRVRRALLKAPVGLAPLDVLCEAMVTELVDIEKRQELWYLRSRVLQRSPHLLVRGLGAHMADELDLARAIAERLGEAPATAPYENENDNAGGNGRAVGSVDGCPPSADPVAVGLMSPELGLYPRLLAAVAHTAVRVSVEYWCAQSGAETFPTVFRRVFSHLSAGLPLPPGAAADTGPSASATVRSLPCAAGASGE